MSAGSTLSEGITHDLLEQLIGQIVSKVEVGQVVVNG
jgi:hypothetical protein